MTAPRLAFPSPVLLPTAAPIAAPVPAPTSVPQAPPPHAAAKTATARAKGLMRDIFLLPSGFFSMLENAESELRVPFRAGRTSPGRGAAARSSRHSSAGRAPDL